MTKVGRCWFLINSFILTYITKWKRSFFIVLCQWVASTGPRAYPQPAPCRWSNWRKESRSKTYSPSKPIVLHLRHQTLILPNPISDNIRTITFFKSDVWKQRDFKICGEVMDMERFSISNSSLSIMLKYLPSSYDEFSISSDVPSYKTAILHCMDMCGHSNFCLVCKVWRYYVT